MEEKEEEWLLIDEESDIYCLEHQSRGGKEKEMSKNKG